MAFDRAITVLTFSNGWSVQVIDVSVGKTAGEIAAIKAVNPKFEPLEVQIIDSVGEHVWFNPQVPFTPGYAVGELYNISAEMIPGIFGTVSEFNNLTTTDTATRIIQRFIAPYGIETAVQSS